MTNGYKINKVRIRQNGVEKQIRPFIPATAISLDKSSITLTTVGQTSQITATLTPADSTSTVSWSSSDTSVATVSNTGLVTCVTPGDCTITATTDNGLTATCGVSSWSPLNPKCWYKFDGDYTDATGTYGVASGTSTFQTLSSGVKVLQTDGTNMVSLPSGITANYMSTFTIIFWMKPITTNPNYGYYAGCGNENNTYISFYENTSGRDFVAWTDGYRDITTSGVGAGWRLVCFRSDGANCDLIINGSNKTATTTAATIFGYSTYNTFVLGARTPNASTATGQRTSVQISNFVISNTYWNDTTCLEMYNSTKSKYGL